MDTSALLISLGGLLLAGITVYLSYLTQKREKTSSYRQVLYTKQIEGCKLIIDKADQLFLILDGTNAPHYTVDEGLRIIDELSRLYRSWFIYFPDSLNEALQSFAIELREILNKLEVRISNNSENVSIKTSIILAREEYLNHYKTLIDAVRNMIGTDQLSTENLRMIGIEKEIHN